MISNPECLIKNLRQLLVLAIPFLLHSHAVTAEPVTHGDWIVDYLDDGSGMYGATANDSEDILGETCSFDEGTCRWVLITETGCEAGSRYVILANSSAGTKPLYLTCFGPNSNLKGKSSYGFEWEELESIIKEANWVGFAVPMESDRFRVLRFSLRGIVEATTMLEAAFLRQMDVPSKRGSRSTRTEIL